MARKHHKRRRGGGNPLLKQALLESRVRFGPEIRGLRELLREARTDYKIGVRAEKGAAQGIQAAADEAMPEIRRIYSDAGHSADTANEDVKKALAGLGHGADPYKAITVGEAGAAKARIGEAMGRAGADVQSRKVQAEEGRHYAIQNLRGQYQQQVGKVHQQAQGLQGDVGAFVQGRYGDLVSADRKARQADRRIRVQIRGQNIRLSEGAKGRAVTKRGQDLAHQDRQAKGGKGKPKFTRVQLRGARAMWGKGLTLLKLHPPKRDQYRDVLATLVTKGVDRSVAVGVWETHFYGGVRKHTRRVLERDYGLKPRVARAAKIKLTPKIHLRF